MLAVSHADIRISTEKQLKDHLQLSLLTAARAAACIKRIEHENGCGLTFTMRNAKSNLTHTNFKHTISVKEFFHPLKMTT